MSTSPVSGAAATTATAPAAEARQQQRMQLVKLAQEFESLLLSNVLRDMRNSTKWDDEDSSGMLGAETFSQTFDSELARSLSQSGGFGLSKFLVEAFDKSAGNTPPAALTAAAQPATLPTGAATPSPVTQALASVAATVDTKDASPDGQGAVQGALRRPTAYTTSGFGWRQDPITGAMAFHRGVDLRAKAGDPVASTGAGRVVFSGNAGGYGTSVIVEHGNGIRTRYAHLSKALVKVGDEVAEGQSIGLAGRTGRATAPHLHYEVIAAGQAVDPLR